MQIFISYARKDETFVKTLHEQLQRAGYIIWRDVTDMPTGPWDLSVAKAIRYSDIFLIVLSPDSVVSAAVQAELAIAQSLNKTIIPVFLEGDDEKYSEKLLKYNGCDFRKEKKSNPKHQPMDILDLVRLLNQSESEISIVLNYREGQKEENLAKKLRHALTEEGLRVWSDLVDYVGPQEHWGRAAQRSLNEASIMLLIVSSSSMYSRRVDAQLRYFLNERPKQTHNNPNHKFIISLVVDKEAKVGLELLDTPYVKFDFNLADDKRFEESFVRLCAAIGKEVDFQFRTETLRKQIEACEKDASLDKFEHAHLRDFYGPLALIKPPVLQSYTNYTKAEVLIEKVHHSLWISGISLSKLSEHYRHFQRLITKDFTQEAPLRFLLINPNNDEVVCETGRYVGRLPADTKPQDEKVKKFQRRMLVALDNLTHFREVCSQEMVLADLIACGGDCTEAEAMEKLTRWREDYSEEAALTNLIQWYDDCSAEEALEKLTRLREAYQALVQIKVIDYRPVMGYFIADHQSHEGFMTAQPYLLDMDNKPAEHAAPFIHLSHKAETKWFDTFVYDFEHQWKTAKSWPITKDIKND